MKACRFILVEPKFPENIGAVARNLKALGSSPLTLVRPETYPHPAATRLATEAADFLEAAQVVETLDAALNDVSLLIATSARKRGSDWPIVGPGEAAKRIANHDGQAAIMFGPEPTGLANGDLERSHWQCAIPMADGSHSLNLAHAVTVLAWELSKATDEVIGRAPDVTRSVSTDSRRTAPATVASIEQIHYAISDLITLTRYTDRDPGPLATRIRRMIHRCQPTVSEANLLNGLLSSALAAIKANQSRQQR